MRQRIIRAALDSIRKMASDTDSDAAQIDVAEVARRAGCTLDEADAVLKEVFLDD